MAVAAAVKAAFPFKDLLADALSAEFALSDELAVLSLLAVRLAVAPEDLESPVCNEALADAECVVANDLVASFVAEDEFDADAVLLALASCELSWVELKLFVEELLFELSFVYDLLLVVEWLREVSRLEELLSLFVTSELLATVN